MSGYFIYRVINASVIVMDPPAPRLLGGMGVLVGQHALLGTPRAAALLAADALGLLLARALPAQACLFDLVGQHGARDQAVRALRALALTLHERARGPVHQHDAGRDLVDVLAALAARVDERLVEIGLADAQRGQALREGPGPV